jgi:hypothetical protein
MRAVIPNAQVDRYEKEDIAAHEIRREAFLDIAHRQEPGALPRRRCIRVARRGGR